MAVQAVTSGGKKLFSIHKGAEHRALGVPESQKLTPAEHARAANSSDPSLRRMEASAKGLAGMGKKRKVF